MSDSERFMDQDRAKTVADWFAGRPRGPYSLEISPTMACNVNCRFCRKKDELADYYSRAHDLTDDRWFEVISEAVAMGARRIMFRGGGDPGLKRSLLKRLFPIIKEKGVHCTLLTNGTLIDDVMAEGFVRSGWQEIIVSLHGGDAATHDYITDQTGSFAAVERSLRALNVAKEAARSPTPVLSFHVVLTRRSYRSIDKIIRFAREYRCQHVGVFPMHNPPYEQFTRELEMSDEDRAEYRKLVPGYKKMLEEYGLGYDFQLSYQGEGGGEKLVDQVLPKAPESSSAPAPALSVRAVALALARDDAGAPPAPASPLAKLPCYFPWYHAALTPNGFVSPCCYGEGKQTKAEMSQVGFKDAWFSHDMAEVRERMQDGRMMEYCKRCPNWYQDDNRRLRAIFESGGPK